MLNKTISAEDWEKAKGEIKNIWAKLEFKELDGVEHNVEAIASMIVKKYEIPLLKAVERLQEVLKPYESQP